MAGHPEWPHLQNVPVYSVGPATTRALRAIPKEPPLNIFGEQTGNGEALSHFMLEHYRQWYRDRPKLPPLLFLVGEQRRDIIPKTLTDETLSPDRRIPVRELVVYGSGVMESFAQDFKAILAEIETKKLGWVVVFSPAGCDQMLDALNLLDSSGRARALPDDEVRRLSVATIGPTTRDFLKDRFGFTADVCALKPSPEGVWSGITRHMANSSG
jgi:uroporphyrinogen-III synthase